jgi:hypothetical protein
MESGKITIAYLAHATHTEMNPTIMATRGILIPELRNP